jgi:RNA polymerase sigma-70 factor (family 1)
LGCRLIIFDRHDILKMNYTAQNDIELIRLLHDGNEEAFAEIYNRYWKRIYTLALSYTKSPEVAQDIVQDVFLKLWLNKQNLLHVQEFKPYLLVASRNLIISSLRNKVFHVSLDEDEQIEEKILLPEKQLSYKESTALLQQAIQLLTPQQQRAYKLSRMEGMKYEQIAMEMDISISTVKIHVSKALNSVRKFLTDQSVHPVLLILILLEKK